MIICMVENCAAWDGQGGLYLIDTSLLTSEPFRSFLESAGSELYVDEDVKFGVCTVERQGWSWQYESDIQRAIVKPPQLVQKLISVTFE